MKHIALMRGINVGGNNKLPMKELARLFTEAGCRDIHTYIQSGNVVFDPAGRDLKKVAAHVEHGIRMEFGFDSPVVLRTEDEMLKAVADNPFPGDEEILSVVFLSGVPAPEAVAALDPARSPGDRFIVRGGEIYLHLPNGLGKSRLTNTWFDSKLKTVSTIRNWKTVLRLVEMAKTD